MPPKRPRALSAGSDDASEYEHASSSDAYSDLTDTTYGQNLRKKASKEKSTQKKRVKRSTRTLDPTSPSHVLDQQTVSDVHPKSIHTINSPYLICIALLEWYATVEHARGMPWRKTFNPSQSAEERSQRAYEVLEQQVWVSEIMLQQTQVATVIPYYNRWMERFPTLSDLASGAEDEVNALWKGLGYYSRARRLLSGAQKVVQKFGGKMPDNAKEMEANIPGIGRYSAGAICSIAFGERVPALDGNVQRLLSRFLALHAPPKAKGTSDILWAAATALVESKGEDESTHSNHAGDINQALIELGSTVCKVREPNCASCPIGNWCAAYQATTNGPTKIDVIDIEDLCQLCIPVSDATVTSYPMKVDKKKSREELDIVNVIEWRPAGSKNNINSVYLLVKRPKEGLLAGLYDFPSSANVSRDIKLFAIETLAHDIMSSLFECQVIPLTSSSHPRATVRETDESVRITNITPGGDVLHIFSHIKKTYRVQWVIIEGGVGPPKLKHCHSVKNDDGKPKKGQRKITGLKPGTKLFYAGAMWVPLVEVADATMGTGVVKVWNLAKALWEKE